MIYPSQKLQQMAVKILEIDAATPAASVDLRVLL